MTISTRNRLGDIVPSEPTPEQIIIDLTGPDWEPNRATRYYAQQGTRFAFGSTPKAALATLLKGLSK